MGAKSAISVEQYLRTAFPDLDREYRDGELVERGLPTYLHGNTQGLLVAFFLALRKTLPVFASVETRMKLRDGLILIPDVSVFWKSMPAPVPAQPPLIAAEVLSPDDRINAVCAKLAEFRAWGVVHVWLVDPQSRRMYTFDTDLVEVPSLAVSELGVEVQPADIFE